MIVGQIASCTTPPLDQRLNNTAFQPHNTNIFLTVGDVNGPPAGGKSKMAVMLTEMMRQLRIPKIGHAHLHAKGG